MSSPAGPSSGTRGRCWLPAIKPTRTIYTAYKPSGVLDPDRFYRGQRRHPRFAPVRSQRRQRRADPFRPRGRPDLEAGGHPPFQPRPHRPPFRRRRRPGVVLPGVRGRQCRPDAGRFRRGQRRDASLLRPGLRDGALGIHSLQPPPQAEEHVGQGRCGHSTLQSRLFCRRRADGGRRLLRRANGGRS